MTYRIFTLLAFLFFSFNLLAQKIYLSKENNGFWIKENGSKIFFFQRELNDSIPTYARNNYFHPVYDLNGNCITEDFTPDHLHHRGIFWAWHQVLINGQSICDQWDIKNFTQNIDQIEFSMNTEGNGVFSYASFWHTIDNPDDPFMREHTKLTVYPRTNNYRRIDFNIELKALEHNLSIGGADNEKGYGGFTVRLATDKNTVFTDPKNEFITPQNLALTTGQFVDISNPEKKSGITFISWPQNQGEEQWILRQTGSAQNCSWPGQTPVDISILEPTNLRYTLIIHKGNRNKVPLKKILNNLKEK